MSKIMHGFLCKLIKFLKGAEGYMESFFILHCSVLLLTIFYIIHREFGMIFKVWQSSRKYFVLSG